MWMSFDCAGDSCVVRAVGRIKAVTLALEIKASVDGAEREFIRKGHNQLQQLLGTVAWSKCGQTHSGRVFHAQMHCISS